MRFNSIPSTQIDVRAGFERAFSCNGDLVNDQLETLLQRRRVLQWLALGSVPLSLLGCGKKDRPIGLVAGVWQGYELLFMAQRRGWFDTRLVKLARLPSNSGSMDALRSGIVDGAALTLDEVIRARAAGLSLTVVLAFDASAGADMLLARSSISELSQLKGKRVGLDLKTNAVLLLALALQSQGLDPQQVQLVDLPFDDQLQAWQQQRVDAVITYEPVAGQLLQAGAQRLFDTAMLPNTIVDVLAVRADVVADPAYETALKSLIAGHFRALRGFRQQPGQFAEEMAPYLKLTPSEVLPSYQGLMLLDAEANRRLLSDPGTLLDSAQQIATSLYQNGIIKAAPDLEGLLDGRFLPSDME